MREPPTPPVAHLDPSAVGAPTAAAVATAAHASVGSERHEIERTIDGAIEDATTLSTFTRWRRALGALAQVMADPEKTDQVLVFSIYANAGSMPKRIHRFFESPDGRRLFEEHRAIDSRTVDLDALAALPEGTLGHAYADFLRSRGLTPTVFDNPPTEVSDPRMQYVVQRLRQTHDLWHVVTGHDTDPASEIALQAFTFAQVRAPSSAILAAAGTLRAKLAMPREPIARRVLRSMRSGMRANPLPVFPWEDHWSTPLVEVRDMLGIPRDGVHARTAA
jgi:ubiquinone biosynthesis protein COQ4